jgi:hypothetical protein
VRSKHHLIHSTLPHQVSTPIKCIFALQIKKKEQEYPSPFDEISMGKDKFRDTE